MEIWGKKKEDKFYITNLGFGIYAVDADAPLYIPYLNTTISCASSGGKYIKLIWAPCKSLDCSGMVIETKQEFRRAHFGRFPYVYEIFVTATCQYIARS